MYIEANKLNQTEFVINYESRKGNLRNLEKKQLTPIIQIETYLRRTEIIHGITNRSGSLQEE